MNGPRDMVKLGVREFFRGISVGISVGISEGYRGVTDQSDTFGHYFTHIRLKHFYMYFSVLVLN